MKSARCTAVAVAAVATLAAAATPAVAASAARPAPHSTRIVLTQADNGAHRTVHPGDAIIVDLDNPRPATSITWNAPTASPHQVLHTVASGVSAEGGDGLFRAASVGTATISATESCTPKPGRVCTFALVRWTATITVIPGGTRH